MGGFVNVSMPRDYDYVYVFAWATNGQTTANYTGSGTVIISRDYAPEGAAGKVRIVKNAKKNDYFNLAWYWIIVGAYQS